MRLLWKELLRVDATTSILTTRILRTTVYINVEGRHDSLSPIRYLLQNVDNASLSQMIRVSIVEFVGPLQNLRRSPFSRIDYTITDSINKLQVSHLLRVSFKKHCSSYATPSVKYHMLTSAVCQLTLLQVIWIYYDLRAGVSVDCIVSHNSNIQ